MCKCVTKSVAQHPPAPGGADQRLQVSTEPEQHSEQCY